MQSLKLVTDTVIVACAMLLMTLEMKAQTTDGVEIKVAHGKRSVTNKECLGIMAQDRYAGTRDLRGFVNNKKLPSCEPDLDPLPVQRLVVLCFTTGVETGQVKVAHLPTDVI